MTVIFPFLLLVMAGGAIGGVARYWVSRIVTDRFGHATWGILAVNATGALAIGLLAGLALDPATLEADGLPHWTFLATGILGSYTTVSSFALQTLELAGLRNYTRALRYTAASLAACIAGAALGLWLGWML